MRKIFPAVLGCLLATAAAASPDGIHDRQTFQLGQFEQAGRTDR